jgi:hypothetical protein
MAHTLASVRDQLENRLVDASNLVFATTTLDEAIRASLGEVNHAYAAAYTLSGLDAAASTTLPDLLLALLLSGSFAHALLFRVADRAEEASPVTVVDQALANFANERMAAFKSFLAIIEGRTYDETQTDAERDYQDDVFAAKVLADTNAATALYAHEVALLTAKHTHEDDQVTSQRAYDDAKDAAETARLTELQESTNDPTSQWEWDEGTDFT